VRYLKQQGLFEHLKLQNQLIDVNDYEVQPNDCELRPSCSLLVPLIQYDSQERPRRHL
jgi:hypothetical protein